MAQHVSPQSESIRAVTDQHPREPKRRRCNASFGDTLSHPAPAHKLPRGIANCTKIITWKGAEIKSIFSYQENGNRFASGGWRMTQAKTAQKVLIYNDKLFL